MAPIAFLILTCTTLFGAEAQVVIKQYIEGTGFNKAIQLENLAADATDVSGYVLEERVNVDENGAVQVRYTFPAGSSISSVFSICNNQASSYMLSDVCDDTAAFGINGNDAITLVDASGSAVDRVGETTGEELVGSKWEVSCVPGATADYTLVRATVSSPPLVPWATGSKQWDVYAKDTFLDSTGTTWDANTGAEDARSPISTCTSASAGDSTTTTTSTTTPATAPVDTAAAAPPTPPTSASNAPAIGVEDGSSCAAPPPASAGSGDRRPDTGALRVATFNAEFLFDGVDDPSFSRWNGDPSGAQEHLEKVAQFIATFEADIVNLVEVEGCGNLEALVVDGGAVALRGSYTGYVRQGTDRATGQDVALLTRVDPSDAITRTDERSDYPVAGSGCGYTSTADTGISKNYVAKWDSVSIGGEQLKVAVVGLHLKAFPTDAKSCAQREGQAAVARATIQELASSGYEVIALGDINDFSIDPPDAASSEPTSMVLDILAGTLPSSVSVPGITTTPRLYNVMEKMPQDQRYTAWYDRDGDNTDDGTSGGENSAIDHILVSEKLWGLVSEVDIIHEAPAGVQGEALSDHWPVLVTFGTPAQAGASGTGSGSGSDSDGAIAGASVGGERPTASSGAWTWVACSTLVAGVVLLVGS